MTQMGRSQATTMKKEYRCMNCGKIIIDPNQDMYSKRFCSPECMDRYMGR